MSMVLYKLYVVNFSTKEDGINNPKNSIYVVYEEPLAYVYKDIILGLSKHL